MKIGYARVSTDEQTLALQHDALQADGCDVVYDDKGVSGTAMKRPGLAAALAAAKEGDTLTVWRIDRLGRTTAGLALLLDELHGRGVEFHSIMDGMDTRTAAGKALYGIMSVLAQLERDLISERTKAGLKGAKRRGKRAGRPPSFTPEKRELAVRLIEDGRAGRRLPAWSASRLRRYGGTSTPLARDYSQPWKGLKTSTRISWRGRARRRACPLRTRPTRSVFRRAPPAPPLRSCRPRKRRAVSDAEPARQDRERLPPPGRHLLPQAAPAQASRGEDFRTLPFDVPPRESAKLDALLRDIRARQEMVKSILEDEDEATPLHFVGSATVQQGVQAVIDSIAAKLEIPLDTLSRRNGTADDLFRDLRSRSERIGVFVLLVGDLGSHHHTISERVFRGFAIADRVAPFVVINDQDAKPPVRSRSCTSWRISGWARPASAAWSEKARPRRPKVPLSSSATMSPGGSCCPIRLSPPARTSPRPTCRAPWPPLPAWPKPGASASLWSRIACTA